MKKTIVGYLILLLSFLLTNCTNNSSNKGEQDSLQILSADSIYFDSLKADFYFDTAVILSRNDNIELSNKYLNYAMKAHYKNIAELFYHRANNFYSIKDYYGANEAYNDAIRWSTKKESRYYYARALTRWHLGYDKKAVCNDVDSAILLGDTSNIAELCSQMDTIKKK